ncbi:hypothetical protein COCON_G00125730 [Conger conger]|uniref:SH3 domain-binding protein 5 n=1 Tax=Conger conger TaxID=82655 RepID=A0A9Q1HWN0_CONCO|nr:hypothetical protein COCON_G00125730 [Conger conger]
MLEDRVSKVKTHYSVALRNLEQISEQIHAQRGRGQGAGAGQWAQARASGGRSSRLQTIASDLQKCDSIGHLGDFSDSVSLSGEEKAGPSRAGPGGAGQERGEGVPADEAQQNFLKQHYRSASL